MLYIRAVGYAAPATQVTSQLFSRFGAAVSPWPEFLTRASVLPAEYISTDGNTIPARSKPIATETPTHLARRAAEQALRAADSQAEILALVIGDTVTPWETTPSEGQRVAGALDLKIPAFDLTSGGCFLSTLSYALGAFRAQALPQTILGISTNAPTQATNFRSDTARFICGDGAAAVLIASQATSGFEIIDAAVYSDPTFADCLVVEHFGHLKLEPRFISEYVYNQTLEILRSKCLRRSSDTSSTALILPSILGDLGATIGESLGFSPRQIFNNFANRGYLFGASSLSVLSDFWDQLKRFSEVFIIECGAGASFGWAQLRRVE